MGDIDTIWFVAGEDEARALLRTVSGAGINPFTKQTAPITTTHFDSAAAAKHSCLQQEWLLGDDVADLLGCREKPRPQTVNGEDELWHMPNDVVAAFAALPQSDLSNVHDAWSRRLAMRKALSHDELVVRRIHDLAREAVEKERSLYGFVEASGR
jgi:hypothetical protein